MPKIGQIKAGAGPAAEPSAPSATWWVYLVWCSDGSLYCGISTDVEKRIATHNAGKGAKFTRSRLPVILHYKEKVGTMSQALKRELEIKALHRWEKETLGCF